MSGPRRAAAPPLRLRLRSGTAARRPIGYETKDREPDGGWGHFKRPRRGQCKRPQRLARTTRSWLFALRTTGSIESRPDPKLPAA